MRRLEKQVSDTSTAKRTCTYSSVQGPHVHTPPNVGAKSKGRGEGRGRGDVCIGDEGRMRRLDNSAKRRAQQKELSLTDLPLGFMLFDL